MKLTVELVPKTVWYRNVRSNVSRQQWDKIRKRCYKLAKYKCEVCGSVGPKHPVECHEIWHYDDKNYIQTLTGLIALCPNCHKAKHPGLAKINGETELVINQLMTVNDMTRKEVIKYMSEAFQVYRDRSRYEWSTDLSYLLNYTDDMDMDGLI